MVRNQVIHIIFIDLQKVYDAVNSETMGSPTRIKY